MKPTGEPEDREKQVQPQGIPRGGHHPATRDHLILTTLAARRSSQLVLTFILQVLPFCVLLLQSFIIVIIED